MSDEIEAIMQDLEREIARRSMKIGRLEAEVAAARAIIDRLPSMDEAATALAAVGSMRDGKVVFDARNCRCDYDVGMAPCEYCAIYLALSKMAHALAESAQTAAKEKSNG